MFAEKIVVGFNRIACVGVLAIAGLFAGSVAHAQNATNTATLTPPTGVTNPGTSCTDTDSDVTTTVSFAGNVCTARDQDPITAPKLHITKTVSASPMVVGVAASYTLKVDNTGTAATTAVATVTDTIPTGLTIGTLPPGCTASGQTVTCTIAAGLPATNGTRSFVIPVTPTAAAAASVTNTASVIGGGDANCATSEGEGCTSTVITPVSTPALELTKNAVLAADQSTITYGFSVRNTGGAVLNNVTVSDPKLPGLSCTSIAVLGINATQTFTCTANVYSTVAADFDAGSVVNVATATGTPAGGTTSVSDDSTVTTPLVPSPKLSITKTAGKATYAAVGEVVSYDYVVTNTGNVIINGLSVSDDKIAAVSCPVSTLAPKAATTCTASYTITQADLDVGSVTNVATANGTPTGGTLTPPTDTETVTSTATPKLTSTKVVTSTGPYTVGSVIAYSVSATNAGNVTLADVVVSDSKLSPSSTTCASLAPNAVCTLTGNYTVTQTDVDAGNVINTASVTTTTPGACTTAADCAPTVTTPVTQTPKLTSTKVVTSTGPYTVGSVIAYSVSATNAGNVTLADVVVSDSKLSPSSTTCASLAPNAVCTLTGNYTVTQTDVDAGNVINTASVTTTTPGACTTAADCTPTVTTPITQTPSLSIDKSAAKATYASVGEVITYTYLVTNTGNVTINGLSVIDDKIASVSCPVTSLVAGAATTCNATYTVTQADLVAGSVTNVATANGTPTGGTLTPPTDTVTVTAQATPIVANDDTMAPVSGSTGGKTPTVLVNDTLDGVPVTTGSVTLHSTGTGSTGTTLGLTTPPAAGSITMNPDGTLTIAPGTTAGTYTYTYEICDKLNTSNCDTAVATVVVTASPIVANDDTMAPVSGSTGGNTPTVLVNDTLDGVPVTTGSVTLHSTGTGSTGTTLGLTMPPAAGSITMNPDGTLTIAPGTTAGTYTYTYEICDKLNTSNCDTAVATVVVGASPIVANDDSATTPQNTPVTVSVLGNDTLDGMPADPAKVTVTQVNPPANGSVVVNPDGTVTYTPNAGYAGTDTFTYQICENLNPANCATATVTVIVLPNSIEANDDSGTTEQNTPVTTPVVANDTTSGPRLNPGDVTIVTPPTYGTTVVNNDGSVTYTPNPNFSGTDTYVYKVCDVSKPAPICDTAMVTIIVTPNRIDAVDDEATTQVDTPVTLAVLGNDTSAKVPLDPASLTVLTPPANGTVVCSAGSCVYTPNPGYVGNDSFVYRVCDVSVPTPVCDTATGTIRIEGETQVRVTKQASPRDVKVGDLVRYTVTLENVGESDVVDGTLIDTPPAGFTLVVGSLEVADRDGAGRLAGSFPIRVDQIDIAKGDRAVVTYLLRVGAGVRGGLHTNAAELHDNGRRISNVGTATVQMVADPMMDESTLLGTVFDDRDGDGWQDSADLSDIRVQGGFAAGAYIANSTTVDRGNGPQAEPDASSPMLHGIAIGKIGGRQSDADPAQARQVVVSQLLRSLDFNGDFVLTSKQGATLRMDAAGKTTVSAEGGDAANGLSAALPSVQRKVSPAEGGYRVDYIIRNDGVDERGIPGVRIASVEGLLVETDQFGRYNLIGVDGGRDDRGRNFILKVDPATLPPGSVFTTKNPLVRRITPGLPVRFDFGVKLPPGLMQGESSEKVEMELGEVMFAPASAEVRSQYLPAVEKMAEQVRSHDGGEVVIAAHGEDELLAFDRAVAVRKALVAALPADIAARTQVSLRTNTTDEKSMVVGLLSWPVLGNVLFDTDKSTIKPEYTALLARIANYLVEMDTRIVKIAGHADRRASNAYNDALGMRRAKAVYDAISAQLPADQRSKVNVELIPGGPDASSGQAAKEVSP